MKQVIIRKGKAVLEEVPLPTISDGMVLVQNNFSVISTGTEILSISFSKKSLLQKIFSEPDKIRKGLKLLKERGYKHTYRVVRGMFEFGNEVGYSSSGIVQSIGKNVSGIRVGDRVACAGAYFANHAEYIRVPQNLVTVIPLHVTLRDAATTTLGAIALQGIRQAELKIGESVLIIGLGLIGQLTVQLARVSGAKVYGIDLDDQNIQTAMNLGMEAGFRADNPRLKDEILLNTNGYGVDTTIICAGTQSSTPINQAMDLTRKRGRVVVVGVIGLNMYRSPWYEKEIELKISTSYGPGRYDSIYEERGVDYPFAYVRWTEKRNMESYLELLEKKKITLENLFSQDAPFEQVPQVYESLLIHRKPIILCYQQKTYQHSLVPVIHKPVSKDRINIGIIGLGSFVITTHLPILQKKSSYAIRALATRSASKAKQYALQCDANYCTTDYHEILKDPEIDAVFIGTRHNLHAQLICDSLKAGKHVFVEKPLCINFEELEIIKKEKKASDKVLFVGYNRRYAPCLQYIKEKISQRKNPLIILYRVNAGYLAKDHWTHGGEGGGRIFGDGCHMIDFFSFLIKSPVIHYSIAPLTQSEYYSASDNAVISFQYQDGSVTNLVYTSLGNSMLSKEYIEIYCDGKIYIITDYKEVCSHGDTYHYKSLKQDKGHGNEWDVFFNSIKNGTESVSDDQLFGVTDLMIKIQQELMKGCK